MLTIAHADRGKPTLKDDDRPFRYGLFRDLKMNAKSMPVTYSMNYKAKHKICVCEVDYNVISTLLLYIICKNIIWPPSSKTAS